MNYLRPDQLAAQASIEKSKKFDETLEKGVSFAKNVGMTAAGAGIISKVAPFLSGFIPADLALKGISKVSPKLGKFLKDGIKSGLDLSEGLSYIRKSMMPEEEQASEEGKDERNIVEKYSPELHEAIKEQIGRGMSPLQAGAVIQNDDKFKDVIKKMSNDNKMDFSRILELSYGSEAKGTPSNVEQSQQPQGISPEWAQTLAQIKEIMNA